MNKIDLTDYTYFCKIIYSNESNEIKDKIIKDRFTEEQVNNFLELRKAHIEDINSNTIEEWMSKFPQKNNRTI